MNQSFTLLRNESSEESCIQGYFDNNQHLGLALHFDGYSDFCSQDNNGTPIYIESFNDELRVIIYGDINQEDPTHIISLENAHISKRDDPIINEPIINEPIINEPQTCITGSDEQGSKALELLKKNLTSRIQLQQIIDVDMTEFFEYDTPDELPEWEWIEANASYHYKENDESGVHDFILNLSNELDIPHGFLAELIATARVNNIHYILFNQGC